MKKNYIAPSMEITSIELQQMIAASGDGVKSDNGITYGGIDTEGKKDPSSRRRGLWDEDEEDDF